MYFGRQDVSRTIERNKTKISFLKPNKTIIRSIKSIKFNNFATFFNVSIQLSSIWIQYAHICIHMDASMNKHIASV